MMLGSIVLAIVALWLGGFVAGYIVPMIPTTTPWVPAIITAMIQIIVLTVFGLVAGKQDIMTLVVGGLLIFVAGIAGNFFTSYANLTGFYATIVVLVVQTVALMWAGYLGKGSKPKLKA
jgi:hypothetical protein